MPVTVLTGNIFTSTCQTLVNTVNCVGVMGAGIALECRLRYPEMYELYARLCESRQINVGSLWLYKTPKRWILNFPTKKDWKLPSRIEYIESGLSDFVATYEAKEIKSIAFPMLGADKGGINPETSLRAMLKSLDELPIDIEIYRYDPTAADDLYEKTKAWLQSQDPEHIANISGLRIQYVRKILDAVQSSAIAQLNQLAAVDGIGIKTLERVFAVAQTDLTNSKDQLLAQASLF